MDKKSKLFYASPELIPAITEGLTVQLQENYKVKISERAIGSQDIEISKNANLAFLGCKIYKQISFSATPTGQIMCQVYGDGFGGLLLPCIIAAIACLIPLGLIVTFVISFCLFKSSMEKKKVVEEIFSMTQEIINANANMSQKGSTEKNCPKCGAVCEGSGFCSECGAKI